MNCQNADILHFLLCLLSVQSWASMAAPAVMAHSRSGGECSRKCWSQRELWQCWYRHGHRPSLPEQRAAGQGRCLRAPTRAFSLIPKRPRGVWECCREWWWQLPLLLLLNTPQGRFSTCQVRALSFLTPCCSPSPSQAFPAELTQPGGALTAQLHPLVPRNLAFSLAPSCPGHQDLSKVQDSLVTADCRWYFDSWKQSPHLSNPQAGRAVKYKLNHGAVVRKHWKGKTRPPSGPCSLASQQSHFYLQPRYRCFVPVSLMCPWAELWAQCPSRVRLAGHLPSPGRAGSSHSSLGMPGAGAGRQQPGMQEQYPSSLASCSSLHCPSTSTVNRERVYQLAGLILFKKHWFFSLYHNKAW